MQQKIELTMRFPGLLKCSKQIIGHPWTQIFPKEKLRYWDERQLQREVPGVGTEEIYFSNWIHSEKLAFLVLVFWASKSKDTLKRINLQEDENENEVGGTPVVKSERLAEKKLDLLSNVQELLQQKQIRKCPYQMDLKLQNVSLFSLCGRKVVTVG